jgi:hypothetical protein
MVARLGAVFIAGLLFGAGCATGGGQGRGIHSLHVFSVPVALDLDGRPGADGFGVTLFASAAAKPKGVPITKGALEIAMFDGVLDSGAKSNPPPRRVWTYTAADLKAFAMKSSLGTGYRLTPRWGDTPPKDTRVTIVARLVSTQPSIQSAPTTIAVAAK